MLVKIGPEGQIFFGWWKVYGLRKNCGRYKNSQTKYTPLEYWFRMKNVFNSHNLQTSSPLWEEAGAGLPRISALPPRIAEARGWGTCGSARRKTSLKQCHHRHNRGSRNQWSTIDILIMSPVWRRGVSGSSRCAALPDLYILYGLLNTMSEIRITYANY